MNGFETDLCKTLNPSVAHTRYSDCVSVQKRRKFLKRKRALYQGSDVVERHLNSRVLQNSCPYSCKNSCLVTTLSAGVETHSQPINVTRFCIRCLSLRQLGNRRGFTAHLGIFNAVFILTISTTFSSRFASITSVLIVKMKPSNWNQTRKRVNGLLCLAVSFIFAIGIAKCDSSYTRGGSKGDKRHGLGFLNLGRKNFISDRAEKYRNNLVLTRIRNADKLNATCIGKCILFFSFSAESNCAKSNNHPDDTTYCQ